MKLAKIKPTIMRRTEVAAFFPTIPSARSKTIPYDTGYRSRNDETQCESLPSQIKQSRSRCNVIGGISINIGCLWHLEHERYWSVDETND